jgi:hypothetical protein
VRETGGWQDVPVTHEPLDESRPGTIPAARADDVTRTSSATPTASTSRAASAERNAVGSDDAPAPESSPAGLPDAATPDAAAPARHGIDDPALTGSIETVDSTKHSLPENVMGVVTGVFLASFGLFLLKESGAVSGGTAGLALLTSYATGWTFGVLFVLVNVPFFALAVWKKGWPFTLRTVLTVVMLSAFSYLHPLMFDIDGINPIYGTLGGNLLVGVGLLILFRHGASLGGINILALVLQERAGLRAGYVQMGFDVLIVLTSLTVVSPWIVLLSALGAVVLNLVLAMNHKAGRYVGHT